MTFAVYANEAPFLIAYKELLRENSASMSTDKLRMLQKISTVKSTIEYRAETVFYNLRNINLIQHLY